MNPDSRLLTTRRSLHGVAELVLAVQWVVSA